MRKTPHERHRDERHHHPCHAAFGQVPLQGDLDEVEVEDDRIDDDGRREDEVQHQLQHLCRLMLLVLAVGDERAAYLGRDGQPDELPDILVDALVMQVEDVVHRPGNGNGRHRECSRNEEAEEQLRGHMQGMLPERAVVHAACADDEQDGRQHIGEVEAVGLEERPQVDGHQGQEQKARCHVGPSVHLVQVEGEHQERDEQ